MQKSPLERLRHIRDECRYLLLRSRELTWTEFLASDDLKRAFVRSLEIVGEASKQVPQPFRDEHPELPWRLMAGMRDRLIHDYTGVDYEIVWDTISRDIPAILATLGPLLPGE
jgi:uncharacterized protein with HEPN domain